VLYQLSYRPQTLGNGAERRLSTQTTDPDSAASAVR
jgi:hypothetical protein